MTMRATVRTGFTILISVRELEAGWTSRAGQRFSVPHAAFKMRKRLSSSIQVPLTHQRSALQDEAVQDCARNASSIGVFAMLCM